MPLSPNRRVFYPFLCMPSQMASSGSVTLYIFSFFVMTSSSKSLVTADWVALGDLSLCFLVKAADEILFAAPSSWIWWNL